MGQLGFGAMLHYLAGGSDKSADEFYGRKIVSASFDEENDRLKLSFEDGSGMTLSDDGQSCCESRYMTCDDDLGVLIGGTLRRIEVKKFEDKEQEYGDEHEQAFIEIGTDSAFVTVVTHNEHNGYYGGFGLNLSESAGG